MNLLKQLVRSTSISQQTDETNQTSQSTTTTSHDNCSGCAEPCDIHPAYPNYLKISKESMEGSVKSHRRHILVAQGKRHQQWIDEVTDAPYRYIHALNQHVERVTSELEYEVRVGAVDLDRLEAEDLDDDEAEQYGDIYLFPDQLVFPRVSVNALQDWVQAVLVEDRGRFTMRGEVAIRHEQKDSAMKRLTELSNQAESLSLDLEFEYQTIEGLSLLICAHNKRDKRCGVTGPILAREFEARIAATRALNEQSSNESSNASDPKVRTFLVSHVGGHKFAGNVIVYPPGLWLGRVKTCHVDVILEAFAPHSLAYNAQESDEVIAQRSEEARKKLQILKRGEIDW